MDDSVMIIAHCDEMRHNGPKGMLGGDGVIMGPAEGQLC